MSMGRRSVTGFVAGCAVAIVLSLVPPAGAAEPELRGITRASELRWPLERPQVITGGYGETRPVAPNAAPDGTDDPLGRQKNRRVEILLTTCP